MYKQFFGLRANPFNVNPDPRYLFLTRHTEEALACLTYGIQSRKGFVLLTGEVGTGKTTLINKLLEWLRMQQVATAFVFNSNLDVPQFLEYMMADFGLPNESHSKSHILRQLYNWLLDRYRAGETAVLIVDEAQNLSQELMEEIRMMTNLETFTEKLLQVILVGQPELEQKLRQPQLRQLRQRITLRAKTYPLTLDETKSYVAQRLRIAGGNGQQIFDSESLAAIHRYSSGIPRIVNLLCEHCLVSAFADQQKIVAKRVVDAVATDFDLIGGAVSSGMMVPSAAAGNADEVVDSPISIPPSFNRPSPSPTAAVPSNGSSSSRDAGANSNNNFDLVDALKTLANLADRLRESQEIPKHETPTKENKEAKEQQGS